MSENHKLANIARQKLALFEKRNEIINSTSEKALDQILSAPAPAALIQSFPEEDLYFLAHSIGLEDSIAILALASSDQWGYMLDVEVWEKDRLDLLATTKWLNLLLLSDKERTVRWLLNERLEFIELYLQKNIDVIIREENQDPSEFPDDFFTFDDYFYIRIVETPAWTIFEAEDGKDTGEERQTIIRSFIDTLVEIDIGLYQKVMLEATSVISAEVEEEDYRMRNVRLAEKGFLPFDDALEIYNPVSLKDLIKKDEKRIGNTTLGEETSSVPVTYIAELNETNDFTRALSLIEDESDLQVLQTEFASLCNQIISADQSKIREKKALKVIVTKACGYVSLGLELLSKENNENISTASLIMKHPLKDIFKLGYGLVMELKWRAEKFKNNGWFKDEGLPLSFWGEKWVGVIGGLLVKRPVFFDNYETGVLYRDFASIADISLTGKTLEIIKNFDDLLSIISPDTKSFSENFLTCYNLLLTLWINNLNEKTLTISGPVPIQRIREFFENLWEPGTRNIDNPGKIKTSIKTQFLKWLSDLSGFTEIEISKNIGDGLEAMFQEIENEYSCVQANDLNPKYIHLFCVE